MVAKNNPKDFEVAITQFSFKNAPLLKLLKQRGDYIKNNNCEKLIEINHCLQKQFNESKNMMFSGDHKDAKDNCFKDCHKPHFAFVTFMHDKAAILAKEAMYKIEKMRPE